MCPHHRLHRVQTPYLLQANRHVYAVVSLRNTGSNHLQAQIHQDGMKCIVTELGTGRRGNTEAGQYLVALFPHPGNTLEGRPILEAQPSQALIAAFGRFPRFMTGKTIPQPGQGPGPQLPGPGEFQPALAVLHPAGLAVQHAARDGEMLGVRIDAELDRAFLGNRPDQCPFELDIGNTECMRITMHVRCGLQRHGNIGGTRQNLCTGNPVIFQPAQARGQQIHLPDRCRHADASCQQGVHRVIRTLVTGSGHLIPQPQILPAPAGQRTEPALTLDVPPVWIMPPYVQRCEQLGQNIALVALAVKAGPAANIFSARFRCRFPYGLGQYRVRADFHPVCPGEPIHDAAHGLHEKNRLADIAPPVARIQFVARDHPSGHCGIQGNMGFPCHDISQLIQQRIANRIHEGTVVGNVDPQLFRKMPGRLQCAVQPVDLLAVSRQGQCPGTVDGCHGNRPVVTCVDHLPNGSLAQTAHGHHGALPTGGLLQMTARPGNARCILQREHPGRPGRSRLSGAVSHTDVRPNPVMRKPARNGNLQGKVGRLCHDRVIHGGGIITGFEPLLPQRAAQFAQHVHDLVECLRKHAITPVQRTSHLMPLWTHACIYKDQTCGPMVVHMGTVEETPFRIAGCVLPQCAQCPDQLIGMACHRTGTPGQMLAMQRGTATDIPDTGRGARYAQMSSQIRRHGTQRTLIPRRQGQKQRACVIVRFAVRRCGPCLPGDFLPF